MKIWYKRLRFKTIRQFVAVLTSKTSDSAIAFGFAIGTFIAILPTPGLNWVLAFLVALVYKKINKLSLFFAIVFWNPLFLAPVYALCYVTGDLVLETLHISQWETVIQNSYMSSSGKFLVGSLVLSLILSLSSYHLALKAISLYKNKRESKRPVSKKNTRSNLLLLSSNVKAP